MKTKRRIGSKIISFLTTVAMAVGMMSGMTVVTEAAVDEYQLQVGGTQIFDSGDNPVVSVEGNKGGTATLTDDSGHPVLTLDNYKYSGSNIGIQYSGNSNLEIKLVGDNSITTDNRHGISAGGNGDINIIGDGTLTIKVNNPPNSHNNGIWTADNSDANVYIGGNTTVDISVNGEGGGIFFSGTGDLSIGENAKVIVETESTNTNRGAIGGVFNNSGIKNISICDNAMVIADGSTGLGSYKGNISISGSAKVIANGTGYYGIAASNGDISIADYATVKAVGIGEWSNGIWASNNVILGNQIGLETIGDTNGVAIEGEVKSSSNNTTINANGWTNLESSSVPFHINSTSTSYSYKKIVIGDPSSVDLDVNYNNIEVGEIFELTSSVSNATDATDLSSNVKWSVTSDGDNVKIYSNADCTKEMSGDPVAPGTVYVKGIAVGNAVVKVESAANEHRYDWCPITVRKATYSVKLIGGANANVDGSTEQTGLTGEMATVTYTAAEGYHFAEFDDIIESGVTAKRTSDTVVTVSGTPTANVSITIPDAVAKVSVNHTVTFKVKDGLWDDGTSSDKEVKLSGYEDDVLKLGVDDIPSAGSKPADGYREGKWDTIPSTDEEITDNVTYTYSYESIGGSTISKKPTANTGLVYTGSEQNLISEGEAESGTMQYALGEDADNAPTSGWSADIPKGTEAGTYFVWYKAVGDDDYLSTEPVCIIVKIAEDTKEESIVALTDVTISGTAKSGQTLTAKITPVDASGNITYQWNRDNAAIDGATKDTYTLTDADVGKKITVSVKQTIDGAVIAEKTSSETDTVEAKDSEKDDDEDNKDDGTDDDDDKKDDDKKDDEIIDDDDKKDDDKKDDAAKDSEVASPPMLKSKTTTSITIIGSEGFEYSIDGGATWQDDTVFEGLEPDTEYSIVCRRKATDTSAAGKVSAKLIVKTNAKEVVTDNEVKDNKEYGSGYIRTETNIDRDVPNNTIVNLDADLAESLMTEEEKKEVRDNGAVCRLYLDVKKMDESKLTDSEKQSIAAAAKQLDDGAELGMFLDLSMFLQVGNNSARQITDLKGKKVTITIEIPEELRRTDGKPRTFYVVRFHEGKAEILAVSGSTTITFETELFSTYSVAYSDNIKPILVSKQKVFGRNYFEKYGEELSKYKYKFKIDDKSQKKILGATKDMIKAKNAGTAKAALYRKTRKGGSWEKIEEHEFVVEKPEVTKKVTTLKPGDAAEALSFVTSKMSVKPTYYLSSKPEVAEVDFETGKIKVLKKGSTTITIAYDNGIGAAKYKTKLVVK